MEHATTESLTFPTTTPRELQTQNGPMPVRQPRVRDHRPPDKREKFSSKILPPYQGHDARRCVCEPAKPKAAAAASRA